MFKCQICGKITKAGEKQTKKIVETRDKKYNYIDKHGNKKVSTGFEIVKEINICEECAKKEENNDENNRRSGNI